MRDAWEALMEAGMPDGAVRPPPRGVPFEPIREAVHMLCALPEIAPRRREPLLAWLRAFRHHFASRFAQELGEEGNRLIQRLEALPFDANRYLKLRRIAIENLCAWL